MAENSNYIEQATVIRSELTHRVGHDLSELLNLARVSRLIPHSQPDSNDLSSHSGRDTETWSWDLVHGTLFTLGKALRLGQENLHGIWSMAHCSKAHRLYTAQL